MQRRLFDDDPDPGPPRPEPKPRLKLVGKFLPRRPARTSSPLLRVTGGWCGEPCLTEDQAHDAWAAEVGRLCAAGHPSVRPSRESGPRVGAGGPAGFVVVGPLPFAVDYCPQCHAYHLRRSA
jgi:hypothetical protein